MFERPEKAPAASVAGFFVSVPLGVPLPGRLSKLVGVANHVAWSRRNRLVMLGN